MASENRTSIGTALPSTTTTTTQALSTACATHHRAVPAPWSPRICGGPGARATTGRQVMVLVQGKGRSAGCGAASAPANHGAEGTGQDAREIEHA